VAQDEDDDDDDEEYGEDDEKDEEHLEHAVSMINYWMMLISDIVDRPVCLWYEALLFSAYIIEPSFIE
jgi:hypothetical protein